MIHTIDAKDKSIGRIATEVAKLLIGKNSTSFKRNAAPAVSVKIINASAAKIHLKKEGKLFHRYSGYPGGLKTETLSSLATRRGYGEVFKRAVKGMLPKNKLQAKMLKNLSVTE
jgi:large subunit ribosomal protein L13